MELYIQVSFWLGIIAIAVRVIVLGVSSYPRTQKIELSGDILSLFIGVCFCIWAGTLVY